MTAFEAALLVSCLARGLRGDNVAGADEGGGGAGGGCCTLGSGKATVFEVADAALEDDPAILEAFELLGGSGNIDGKTGPPPSARKVCG